MGVPCVKIMRNALSPNITLKCKHNKGSRGGFIPAFNEAWSGATGF